jgi:endonuclease/exonuclease/phosphatase family metal-dependent hydrolase
VDRDGLVDLGLLASAFVLFLLGFGLPERGPIPFEPASRPAGGLRVVTWNVGGTGSGDGRPLEDDHVPAVAESLRLLDADLVFLQELRGRDQLAQIARAVGRNVRFEVSEDSSGCVGVLAPRANLSALTTGDWEGRRHLALLAHPEQGPALHIVVLHAHAWSARRRNREIGQALDLLVPATLTPARMLVGDLNVDIGRHGRNDLFTNDEPRDVASYNYVARHLRDVGEGQGPTAEPDRRLDYLFASPELRSVQAGPWHGRRVGDMDHHPLVADLVPASGD